MTALEAASERAHPGAMLVDQDRDYAYFRATGQVSGLSRVRFTTAAGKIQLGKPEPLRLRSATESRAARPAEISRDLAEIERRIDGQPKQRQAATPTVAAAGVDFAPLAPPPEAWGGWGPPPPVYSQPAELDRALRGGAAGAPRRGGPGGGDLRAVW